MRTTGPRSIVNSRLQTSFRRDFAKLPREIQERARAAYRRFRENPNHPGLQFKRLHTTLPLWSVRITDSYRAVGVRNDIPRIAVQLLLLHQRTVILDRTAQAFFEADLRLVGEALSGLADVCQAL